MVGGARTLRLALSESWGVSRVLARTVDWCYKDSVRSVTFSVKTTVQIICWPGTSHL